MRLISLALATTLASIVILTVPGCDDGPSSLTGPELSLLADKRPCPVVAVTYRDPDTIDPDWSGGIKDFSLIRSGDHYHLFHITDPGTSWISRAGELTLGHASAPVLGDWTTHDRIDLRTGPDGWSPSFTWAPHVIKNDDDGLYYMFYTGVKWPEGTSPSRVEQRIGLATSSDLVVWERHDDRGQDGLVLDGPDHEAHPWSAFDTDHAVLAWEYDCRDPFVFDRGAGHVTGRYVLLASVRLAPDATQMAIAYATSHNLVDWHWRDYVPATVGVHAESANLIAHGGHHYLFWTARADADAVKVACSTTGVFGEYVLVNDAQWLFGIANETLAEEDRTLYLAFDDAYVLHIKRDVVMPDRPTSVAPVEIREFTRCAGEPWHVFEY